MRDLVMTSQPRWHHTVSTAATAVLLMTGNCAWITRSRLLAVSFMSLLSTIFMFASQPPDVRVTNKPTSGVSRLLLTLHCCAVAAPRTQPQDGVVQLNWYPSGADDEFSTEVDGKMGNTNHIELRRNGILTTRLTDTEELVAVGNGTLVQISDQSRSASLKNSTGRWSDCRMMQSRGFKSDRRHFLNRTTNSVRERSSERCRNTSATLEERPLVEKTVNNTRRLPHCLIIGVRKGGTRALLEFLSLHPGVSAEKQEVHFFDDDWRYSQGFNWYRQQMRLSWPEQITIEKTPAYFVSPRVPSRVRRMNESIKLLVIVRDPVERAISDYMQIHASRLARGKFHASFEHLVLDRRTGAVDRTYRAIWRSLYDRHMARWLHHFRLDQFHLVDGDKLVRNPVDELRRVERFLGLEHKLSADKFYLNATRGFYCMRQAQFGDQSTRTKAVNQSGGHNSYRRQLGGKCLSSSKGRPHPDIDPLVIKKLRQFFRQHNERFYQMIGVNFGWPV